MATEDQKNDQASPTDIFGDSMDPLPQPIPSGVQSPEAILDIIKNGKIAQTREEFLGIPPREESSEGGLDADSLFSDLEPQKPQGPQEAWEPPVNPAPPERYPDTSPTDIAASPSGIRAETSFAFGSNQPESGKLEIPKIPVGDRDIDRFLLCVKDGKYYSETFEKGDFRVTFRIKSALEIAWIRACLSRMIYVTNEVRTIEDMNQAILRFNLLFQVAEIGGRRLTGVAVPGPPPWKDEDLNLEALFWKSEFSTMTEITLFMVQSMMVQFETKVRSIEMMVIDPKYSSEGVRS